MVQTERRHDRLAVRLSIIISRLLAGETLSVQKLAAEFAVSPRTLRRDFRERLMYMGRSTATVSAVCVPVSVVHSVSWTF
jgi:predicted DNA-binding transcriptional regulator YafY